MVTSIVLVASQVDAGEVEIVNIRETDSRLGPLITSLVGLGIGMVVATVIFWWLTRPRAVHDIDPNSERGERNG